MDEAVDWARTIISMAPRSIRNFHQMAYQCWNMTIPQSQSFTSALEYNLRGMNDGKEGPRAFAESGLPSSATPRRGSHCGKRDGRLPFRSAARSLLLAANSGRAPRKNQDAQYFLGSQ